MYTRVWRFFHIYTDENGRNVRREIFLPTFDSLSADDGMFSPFGEVPSLFVPFGELPSLPAPMTVEEGLRSDTEAVLGDATRAIGDFAAACEREMK